MAYIVKFGLFVVSLAFGQAQIIKPGSCPDVNVVDDFDASKYVGKWYEYERYPFIFELFGECVTANYSANSDGTIAVYNRQINEITKMVQTIKGTASFDGPTNVAKLGVAFQNMMAFKGSYWVLGTDYDNYSVVWSCTPFGFLNFQISWILTRDPHPSNETLSALYEVIDTNKIDKTHYEKTNQQNCKYESYNAL